MSNTQQLGGTRQGSPLEDEMSYPLTKDEYYLIKDNLSTNKFTNWEAFLLTSGITSLISGIVIWATGTLIDYEKIENVDTIKVNTGQIIILIIYGSVAIGSILGFMISRFKNKDESKPIDRLIEKILNHLNKPKI